MDGQRTRFQLEKTRTFLRSGMIAAAAALSLAVGTQGAHAQELVPPAVDLTDLDGDPIVVDLDLAIALGKALFWDTNVGSDGMACASCHFSAGADSRITNQYNPGFLDETVGPEGDDLFGAEMSDGSINTLGQTPSGNLAEPNYTLGANDFPLHQLTQTADRNSTIVTSSNDRVSSMGAYDRGFRLVRNGVERCRVNRSSSSIFHVGRFAARQVEPRNTPTVINAAFFDRQFWDGRANRIFNGVGVFGLREVAANPAARLVAFDGGNVELTHVEIDFASLGSQSVGPPLSALEMSCGGRDFKSLAIRVLSEIPLSSQMVDSTDSVFGPLGLVEASGRGLNTSYETLIENAFNPKWWDAGGFYEIREDGSLRERRRRSRRAYSQMATNFSLFWGISVMEYMRTLISGPRAAGELQSEFDRRVGTGELILAGPFSCVPGGGAPNDAVVRGCDIFFGVPFLGPPNNGPGCALCHSGADLFTSAGFQDGEVFVPIQSAGGKLLDRGFFNIGVQPVFTDRLNGGTDQWGNPLSYARQFKALELSGVLPSDPTVPTDGSTGNGCDPNCELQPTGVDGTAKTPSLRNVALTPPYFQWGGAATLRQVLEFYNRGGNRREFGLGSVGADEHPTSLPGGCTSGDSSGTGLAGESNYPLPAGDCGSNASGLIQPLGLSEGDLDDLEAFLRSLTDPAVQCDMAPFDHPSLPISMGHLPTDANRDRLADDMMVEVPEVGADGYAPGSGFCVPNEGNLFATGMQARVGGAPAPAP